MLKLRRILVPVKDSQRVPHAAALKAAQIARYSGGSVELFHAYDELIDAYALPYALDPQGFERQKHLEIGRRLERLASKLRKLGVDVTTRVATDYPAHEAVVRRAIAARSDLIVTDALPVHRAPVLLRATDWELLRQSPVPVLLTKVRRAYRRPTILAAVDPQHSFSKPSGLDREIVAAANALARTVHGRVHALHAFVPIAEGSLRAMKQGRPPNMEAAAADAASSRLKTLLRATRIPSAARHLVPRHPLDAIPEVAGEIDAAIVVMGAVSRSGFKWLFIGNTAEILLDTLRCDVLVVKPKGFKTNVPPHSKGLRWRLLATLVP